MKRATIAEVNDLRPIDARAIELFQRHGRMTAAELGSRLWNNGRFWKVEPRHLARPAGAVIKRLLQHSAVEYDVERRRRYWRLRWKGG